MGTFPLKFMTASHLMQVVDIERAVFGDLAWVHRDFLVLLNKRNHMSLVAIDGDRVAGYVIYEHDPPTIGITRLVVDPSYRRAGWGAMLLRNVKQKLSPHRYRRLVRFTSERNLDEQLFLRACGLRAIAILPYFWERTHDCYVFEYWHSEPTEMWIRNDLSNRLTAYYQ